MPIIPIFVSSTFRDFHAERDSLVGEVRAALDEHVAALGCRVEVIDLRWGIGTEATEDEATQQSKVLGVCLGEVERARPLFVSLIGNRYGWVPPRSRLEATAREADLDVHDLHDVSITELELEKALRAEGVSPVVLVRTIVGDMPTEWGEDDPRLDRLSARATQAPGATVATYEAVTEGGRLSRPSVVTFEQVALDSLRPLVVDRAKELHDGDSDPFAVAQQLFVEERLEVVAGRSELIDGLVEMLEPGGTHTCLHGISGSGKSTVWCAVVERLRESSTDVVSLAVGHGPASSSGRDLVRRLLEGLGLEAPEGLDDEQLTDHLHERLADRNVVVALDGLNELDPGAARERLSALVGLPSGPRFLATTTEPAQVALLGQAGFASVELQPLDRTAVEHMVEGMASARRRDLPAAVVAEVASSDRSPLWVRLAFEVFTGLDEDDLGALPAGADPIAELLVQTARALPSDVEGLAVGIFDRCSQRFGTNATAWVMGALAISRSGLSPLDLAQLTHMDPISVAGLRRRAAGSIVPRSGGGRLGFAHGILRSAARSRFAGDDSAWHAHLSTHLLGVADEDPAVVGDRLFHAVLSGQPDLVAFALGRANAQGAALDAGAFAFSSAVVSGRSDVGPNRALDVLRASPSISGAGLDFLTRWLGHPARRSCPSSDRLEVARLAVALARRSHLQLPEGLPMGFRWLGRLRGDRLSENERAYFDWVTTAEGRAALTRLSLALRAEALTMLDAGEARVAAKRVLAEAEQGLSMLHELHLAMEDHRPSTDAERREQLFITEELAATRQAAIEIEIESSSRNDKRIAAKLGQQTALAEHLGELGAAPRSVSLRRLQTLDAQAEAASATGHHDEATGLARQLLDGAKQLATQHTGDDVDEMVRQSLLRAGTVAHRAGDSERALALLREHETRARREAEHDPTDVGRSLTLIEGILALADADGRVGGSLLDEGIDRCRTILRDDSASVPSQRLLSSLLEQKGDLLTRDRRGAEAFEPYDEAFEIRKRLQRRGHSGSFQAMKGLARKRDLAKAHNKGGFLSRMIELRDRTQMEERQATRRAESQRISKAAETALSEGDVDRALALGEQALSLDEEMRDEPQGDIDGELSAWIGHDLRFLAKCHSAQDDRLAVLSRLEEAAVVERARGNGAQPDASVLASHSDTLHALARAQERAGLDARATWEEAADVGRRWVATDPRAEAPARGLCAALYKLSLLGPLSGDLHEAHATHLELVSCLRLLIERVPDISPTGTLFRSSVRRLARATHLLGDDQEAATLYAELVACELAAQREDPEATPELREVLREAIDAASDAGRADEARGYVARMDGLR